MLIAQQAIFGKTATLNIKGHLQLISPKMHELSRSPDRPKPLLVTFGADAEQAAALQSAKNLQDIPAIAYTYGTPVIAYTYGTPAIAYIYGTPAIAYTYDTPAIAYIYDIPAIQRTCLYANNSQKKK